MPSRASAPIKKRAENGRAGQSGTRLAILDLAPSCTLDTASGALKSTWGGPRNRAERVSLHLSRRQATDLIAATLFARSIGKPFDRHWTVHYELAGIAEHDATRFIGKLIDLARKQARRDGGELAAAWAREGGEGKGGHVHMMLHLPPGMTLRNRTRRWIKAAGGNPIRRVSKVRTIGGSLKDAEPSGAHYRANADALLAYLCKAASMGTGRALSLPRYGEGGVIIGKRAGWTQNIGKAAQSEMASLG